jgi:hypothetical protein
MAITPPQRHHQKKITSNRATTQAASQASESAMKKLSRRHFKLTYASERQSRFAAMSAFKSAAIARNCSAIRMTGNSLASLSDQFEVSCARRSASSRFLSSSILVYSSRVHACFAGDADRDI